MQIEYDPEKSSITLRERGWKFERAAEVFQDIHFTAQDSRFQYQEDRFITVGWLDGQLVVLVWTPRGESRRIISMRKGNDREKALYARHLERS
jgi:uncharacterized DUF497 family protein